MVYRQVEVVVLVVVSSRHNYLKYLGLQLVVEVARMISDNSKCRGVSTSDSHMRQMMSSSETSSYNARMQI